MFQYIFNGLCIGWGTYAVCWIIDSINANKK